MFSPTRCSSARPCGARHSSSLALVGRGHAQHDGHLHALRVRPSKICRNQNCEAHIIVHVLMGGFRIQAPINALGQISEARRLGLCTG